MARRSDARGGMPGTEESMLMARIFVCHPYAGDPAGNAAAVRRIARRIALQGHVPIAPQRYLPQFIDEATERDLALRLCLELVAASDILEIHGDEITDGMRREITEARWRGIRILKGVGDGD